MAQNLQPLVERYLAAPTPAHREAVVLAAVPFVRALIGRLPVPHTPLADAEDLEGAGLLGLLQALDAYDAERGTPFISFAYGRVRGALVDYLRRIDVLSQDQRRQMAAAQQALDTLRQLLGEEPSDEDVADYLGISLEAYHALLAGAQCRFALSLDHAAAGPDARPLLDVLPLDEAAGDFEAVDMASTLDYVTALIRRLPERERQVLALYYYENLTLREIGSLLGLTEARISQILGKTLLTLRARLRREEGGALAA